MKDWKEMSSLEKTGAAAILSPFLAVVFVVMARESVRVRPSTQPTERRREPTVSDLREQITDGILAELGYISWSALSEIKLSRLVDLVLEHRAQEAEYEPGFEHKRRELRARELRAMKSATRR